MGSAYKAQRILRRGEDATARLVEGTEQTCLGRLLSKGVSGNEQEATPPYNKFRLKRWTHLGLALGARVERTAGGTKTGGDFREHG